MKRWRWERELREASKALGERIDARIEAEQRAAAERLKTVHRAIGQIFKRSRAL